MKEEMKDPKTMGRKELQDAYRLYLNLRSRGVRDEMYILLLENEIDKRRRDGK